MEQISNMLSNDRSVEDLLAIDPETYTFESFDKTIFFTLLREALTGAPQQEGTELSYWEKPSYAFFCEPDWTDGYKFQIAFLQETGGIDVIYIDVLYQNGTEYNDYFQLSDLVDSGQATPAQNDAFALITQIKQQVEAEDNFIACADLYRDKIIEKIDFSRLWRFMLNLHENNYTLYLESPIVEEVEQSDTN